MLLIQVALVLVVVVGVLSFAFRSGNPVSQESEVAAKQMSGKAKNTRQASGKSGKYNNHYEGLGNESRAEAESFPFDPNTADSMTLRRLGLTDFQIANIYRYRAKGGVYHRVEEFKKLYSLSVGQWNHLRPLIRIGEEFRYLADTPDAYSPAERRGRVAEDRHERDSLPYPRKLAAGQTIDLNLADTTALKRIPGIGSYYARKIVEYRNKLGGFVSLSQLEDLENLPLGIEDFMTLEPTEPRKLRINHSTLRELNAHPYISYYQARAIVDRIRLFGPVRSMDELGMSGEFTARDLERLAPYVEF